MRRKAPERYGPEPPREVVAVASKRNGRAKSEEIKTMSHRTSARYTALIRARLEEERDRLLAEAEQLSHRASSCEQIASGERETHPADAASERAEREIDVARRGSLETRVSDVEAALSKLEAGQYGQCEDCGRPIPVARLRALPWARRCIDCESRRAVHQPPELGAIHAQDRGFHRLSA